MEVSVEQVYTSVACNRTPEIVDWNSNGVICYGASNAVVIYNPELRGKDILVLSHHTSNVNAVKWLNKPYAACTEFLSCSADKTAAVWTFEKSWQVTSKLEGHTEGVTCVFGMYTNENNLIIYTGSIDSTIKIWERIDGETSLKQTINLHSGLCLTLHAHILPSVEEPLLFCALDDHKIHIYASDNKEYHKVHSLVGHEDWVRGMDVLNVENNAILLASCSQDTYIRLWRIQPHTVHTPTSEIRVEEKLFHAHNQDWSVKLDAVLAGHEGWVYGVQWHPYDFYKKVPVYRLLSSSLDKTLIVWEPEEEGGGVWVERVRVGEVGGNALGFYGSRFGPKGDSFLGHGYNGSFHIWSSNKESGAWESQVVCGGHFGCVEDVKWEPTLGRYLISVSADQTARLHAPWKREDLAPEWHEIARPQVHGYDLAAVAPVSSTTFASAAEEKVIRVFKAPQNFLLNFKSLVGEDLVEGSEGAAPEGATQPSLGLSNKAVFSDEEPAGDEERHFTPVTLTKPPTEETLMQNTLWPEVQKLYGHGYEVFALEASAASADGRLLASACKATTKEHASVLIWDTSNWQKLQVLVSHQLTVTQLAFSPDSQRLLSVSRDRRWTLYERSKDTNLFGIAAGTDKTNGIHSRIIWCCAWGHDSEVFATGSREGKICVWSKIEAAQKSSLNDYALYNQHREPNQAVTALAFAPLILRECRVLAAGLESGVVKLYSFAELEWTPLYEMNNNILDYARSSRPTLKDLDLPKTGAGA
ncbi:probable elongator complex protein 2 [Ostrinia furnacalis]|uniref:probable elongator complex protein 2 n=1 Tax=Ostrinia furnacalis TaxID=93504 RepID=UPI001038998D|nr:probable elongator complex protein 2 [Ostrinia furnacalis]